MNDHKLIDHVVIQRILGGRNRVVGRAASHHRMERGQVAQRYEGGRRMRGTMTGRSGRLTTQIKTAPAAGQRCNPGPNHQLRGGYMNHRTHQDQDAPEGAF